MSAEDPSDRRTRQHHCSWAERIPLEPWPTVHEWNAVTQKYEPVQYEDDSAEAPVRDADMQHGGAAQAGLPLPAADAYVADMHAERVELHANDDDWLQASFEDARSVGAVRVLQLEEGQSAPDTVVLMAPHYDLSRRALGVEAKRSAKAQQLSRLCPFAVIKIRLLQFSDGPQFVCTCGNAGCHRSKAEHTNCHNQMRIPEQRQHTVAQALGGQAPLCRCAVAAIYALWGDGDSGEDSPFFSFYHEQNPFSALFPSHLRLLACLRSWSSHT